MSRAFTQEEKAKLTQLINEGLNIKTEIQDLRGGFNDTVKHIAEEMQISPAVLRKVIDIAFRANLQDERAKMEEIEHILDTVGRS